MKGTLQRILSLKVFSYVRYLPALLGTVENWHLLLLNYTGIINSASTYFLRNNLRIKVADGMGAAILFLIFILRDYGPVPPKNSVVIDIGAHVGIYSLYATQSPGTKVFAFEPVPENFFLLRENIQQNGLGERIFSFPVAVSSKTETARIYLRSNASGLHSTIPIESASFQTTYKERQKGTFIEVSSISLRDIFDQYNVRQCDVLKMDCEGSEYDILYAFPDEYFNRIRSIRLEYHDYSQDRKYRGRALLSFLEHKGFTIKKVSTQSSYQGTLWIEKL